MDSKMYVWRRMRNHVCSPLSMNVNELHSVRVGSDVLTKVQKRRATQGQRRHVPVHTGRFALPGFLPGSCSPRALLHALQGL